MDAAEGLAIASPYELVALDPITAGAIEGAMEAALGELGSVFEFGYRFVAESGEQIADSMVMVMNVPSGALTSAPGFLESVAGGIAGTASGSVETTTILDREVAVITTEALVYAAYQSDTAVVMVLTPTLESSEAIVTALISASE